MADLQEQLQSILSNPEAMSQISAMAQALSGSGQAPSPATPAQESEYVPVEPAAQAASAPDLSALLGMLGGGGGRQAPDIDPRMVQMALRLYGEYANRDDRKTALFAALAPFLKEDRRATLEKADRASRLARVIRSAMGMLGEEASHV